MRLLLVEDDRALGQGIRVALGAEGYTLDWLQDGVSALHALRTESFDLLLLDLGLPRLDGLTLLQTLRAEQYDLPVLILTARDGTAERIAGLDAGADDYLVKPFDLEELAARIRALLRRQSGRAEPLIALGDLTLNPATHEVLLQGRQVNLSAREYALLCAFLDRPGAVLSRAQLEEKMYGWDDSIESNAIEVYIHALRKKLGSSFIKNVRGIGYMVAK